MGHQVTSSLATSLPGSFVLAERRMYRRYEFSALVKIGKPLEGSDAFPVPECMEAHVSDLGKRGCFVTTAETLPVGANVSARIIQEKKTCDVRARVVYSLAGHGMGLLFTDAEPEQLRIMEGWLAASREASWFASTRRRSQRVVMRVPVKIVAAPEARDTFEEDTHTMVINAHGCSLALSRQVHKSDQLLLRNLQTAAMQECTVVHVGDLEEGRREVAVEFLVPNPSFWQVMFPPEDWTPGVTHVKKRVLQPIRRTANAQA
jgi:hypothetical protein